MGAMDLTFQDVLPDTPTGVCCCGCCSVVNFILIILFFPCTVVQLGQFRYGLVKNKITGTVDLENSFSPGRYWIGFWKEFITFPSTLNTIEFSDDKPEDGVQHLSKLVSRDNEGKQIYLDVSIQYRLLKPALGKIYANMTTLYEDVYISDLRDRLSKAANEFTISQAWTDYNYVVNTMFSKCKAMLANKGAECWGLQLWGVSVTEQYENLLIKTQVQKQKKETSTAQMLQAQVRAITQTDLATFTRDIKIVNAQATANRINIEREAVSKAEANLVEAQAQVLKIIKDTVNLNNASGNTYVQQTNGSAPIMTDEQLIVYQKYVMLQKQEQSHIVVDLADGLGALNAASAAQTMSSGRRLGEL
jgi:regulator of protease activity HflC (stomatin/prohibitin superfamily)